MHMNAQWTLEPIHTHTNTHSYTWINSKSKGWYSHAHWSSQSFFFPFVVVVLSTYKIWNYFKTLFACFIIIKNCERMFHSNEKKSS